MRCVSMRMIGTERDLLFAFKKRALVHFAVDPDEVWMTTRLQGKVKQLFPAVQPGEHDHGAGNPPVEGDLEDLLPVGRGACRRDSLLEILQRFMHLEVKEKQVSHLQRGVRTVRKETMIFPRYHQLDAVQKARRRTLRAHGSGRNYLVQHSAGSGKSNSIAWLAHRLGYRACMTRPTRRCFTRSSL